MKLGEKMEKLKQIHLQIHLYLGNQKPQSAEMVARARVSFS